MYNLLPGGTTSVRYKGQEFDQIVQQLRFQVVSPHTTILHFTGMPKHQLYYEARALAMKMGRHLHKVDTRGISSKYIGETEKHLNRMFHRASHSNTILYFDEADALFGKRTDVKDAHDRYANQETNYLLQKLEKHKGLVILATQNNTKFKGNTIRKVVVRFPPV